MAADYSGAKSEAKAYKMFMQEAKTRYFAIQRLISRLEDFHPQIVHETCALQLRMLCECIALACLSAHHTLASRDGRKLTGRYEPGAIIRGLEKLHPKFYPLPHKVVQSSSNRTHIADDADAQQVFLSRQKLIDLWNRLGHDLHRGNLDDIKSGRKGLKTRLPDYSDELRSIEALLTYHVVGVANFGDGDLTHIIVFHGLMDDANASVVCQLAV